MKIVQLCKSTYPTSVGGVEVYVHDLTKLLKERGHEVRIIMTQKDAKRNASRMLFDASLRQTFKKLNDEPYDCLHIQSFASLGILELGLVLIFNRLKKRKPVIITPHGSFNSVIYSYNEMSLKLLLQRIYVFYLRRLAVLVNFFVVFTEGQQDLWRQIGFPAEKVIVLPPFVDLDEGIGDESLIKKETKNVLFVGRLSKEKGIDFLIRAIPRVLNRNSDVKLHIVGDGLLRKELENLTHRLGIENSVVFHGFMPHEKLAQIYRRSDVFVLPSVCAECFPLVLLEAMKHGLPVVTTDFGGQAEMVKRGFNGELVHPRDSEDLAKKISIMLNYPELTKNMSNNAKRFAGTCSAREHVKRLEEVYRH